MVLQLVSKLYSMENIDYLLQEDPHTAAQVPA